MYLSLDLKQYQIKLAKRKIESKLLMWLWNQKEK